MEREIDRAPIQCTVCTHIAIQFILLRTILVLAWIVWILQSCGKSLRCDRDRHSHSVRYIVLILNAIMAAFNSQWPAKCLSFISSDVNEWAYIYRIVCSFSLVYCCWVEVAQRSQWYGIVCCMEFEKDNRPETFKTQHCSVIYRNANTDTRYSGSFV